jgi:hypothetical protein
MVEFFGYVYVIGAVGTGLLSACLYLKIYFDTEEKNESLFGWIFTCVAMCPVWALFWPFVIKAIWNDLSNFEKNKQGAIKQREYQDWVAGFQEDMDKPPPPWIDPKRFSVEIQAKQVTQRDSSMNNPRSTESMDSSPEVVSRPTAQEMRRNAFSQRYRDAHANARKYHDTILVTKTIKNATGPITEANNPNMEVSSKAGTLMTSEPEVEVDVRRQSIKDGYTTAQTLFDEQAKIGAYSKCVICHLCRHSLAVDTLQREMSCPNCGQRIVVH